MTPDPTCSDPTHVALFYRDGREYVVEVRASPFGTVVRVHSSL
jgi:hypothetical protein